VKLEVGKTYRFNGAEPYREYGEWTVSRKDKGRCWAVSQGTYNSHGSELCMYYEDDPVTNPAYRITEVTVVDEVADFFV